MSLRGGRPPCIPSTSCSFERPERKRQKAPPGQTIVCPGGAFSLRIRIAPVPKAAQAFAPKCLRMYSAVLCRVSI